MKQSTFWHHPESERQESPSNFSQTSKPEVAITLDFNVKNGSVVKTTSIKEPSVERNFELRRSARFSSRESSVIKAEEKPFENPYHHKDTKGNRESFKKNKNLRMT